MNGIVFPQLPLNTKRIYVRGICKSGCEVWIPSISHERAEVNKKYLQNFLNNQPEPKKARA